MRSLFAWRAAGPARLALALAVAGPLLLNHAPLPQTGFAKDLLGLLAWGLVLACGPASGPAGAWPAGWRSLVAVPLLLVGMAWTSVFATGGLPGLALADSVALLAAVAVLLGLRAARAQDEAATATVLYGAWAGAALLNAAVALLELTAPQALGLAGPPAGARAVGWVRQSNVLALLMVQGVIALAALRSMGRLPPRGLLPAGLLLMAGLAASGSRTGLLASGLLLLWGLFDGRLPPRLRLDLVLLPLALCLFWALRLAVAEPGQAAGVRADLGSPRWTLWQDAWALVRAQPLWGVGWNNFNFAWTLSPGLPAGGHAFTHAHNLPLHLAVELGLPLAAVVLLLLVHAAWRGLRAGALPPGPAQPGPSAAAPTAAGLLILSTALHSLSEFPLWQGHLLWLHAACWALAGPSAGPSHGACRATGRFGGLRGVGLLLMLSAVWGGVAQQPTIRLFDPAAGPLERRLAAARAGSLSPEWGERLAATLAPAGQRSLQPFEAGAARRQLDGRLLLAWALAEAEQGRADRARLLAARLRRLGGPAAAALARRCDAPPRQVAAAEASGQGDPLRSALCGPPPASADWRELLPPGPGRSGPEPPPDGWARAGDKARSRP